MQTLNALDSTLRSYLNPEQTNHVKRAYFFAEQAHFGQVRRSGEDYVTHPWPSPAFSPTCTWTTSH